MELAGAVNVTEVDGIAAIELIGEHDLGTVPDVRGALADAAESNTPVLIDLCPTTFVDSSILGAILEARRDAVENARGFAVACEGAAEAVSRVLHVTGLAIELPVHPTRDAALAALARHQSP